MFLVSVKGSGEANILFSSCQGCDGYRITLGANCNSQSYITQDGGEDDQRIYQVYIHFSSQQFNLKRLFTFHSKTPDILNPGKFQRFQVDLNENSKEFKIEVRKHGENVTLMERTWEKASLPWSNLSIVAFSEYGAKPVYYKHKVKGIATINDG